MHERIVLNRNKRLHFSCLTLYPEMGSFIQNLDDDEEGNKGEKTEGRMKGREEKRFREKEIKKR